MTRKLPSSMSLRDYFAAKAISRVMQNVIHFEGDVGKDYAAKIAKSCYVLADAMLTERSK